jgi:hypothetical protein
MTATCNWHRVRGEQVWAMWFWKAENKVHLEMSSCREPGEAVVGKPGAVVDTRANSPKLCAGLQTSLLTGGGRSSAVARRCFAGIDLFRSATATSRTNGQLQCLLGKSSVGEAASNNVGRSRVVIVLADSQPCFRTPRLAVQSPKQVSEYTERLAAPQVRY